MMMKEYDRLSDLPDSLIFEIFGRFTTTYAVRATILSKRWKNLWTTIPFLDFNNATIWMESDKFRNFVNKVLKSWRGNKIFRFGVTFHTRDEKLLNDYGDDINSWMRFAVEKKVEELRIVCPICFCVCKRKLYLVVQDLYSCSSLKHLELGSCDIQIHGHVKWDQLKSLKIWYKSLNHDAIDKILCGSPRLESLTLRLFLQNENLNISSSSLKRLEIDKFLLRDMEDTEVRISTPNLEHLEISGDGYSKCLLMNNMPSLRVAALDFHNKVPQNVVGEMLTQILPVIKHVERVSLSDSCIKALGAVKEKGRVSICFPNANYLELKSVCWEEHYEQIVGVLEMFPQLRDLGLRTTQRNNNRAKNTSFKLEKNAKSFLPELRRVEVTCAKGDESTIPLVQILAKYARNLEKLVWWEEVVGTTELLLEMGRSSPNEDLIFDIAKLRLQAHEMLRKSIFRRSS